MTPIIECEFFQFWLQSWIVMQRSHNVTLGTIQRSISSSGQIGGNCGVIARSSRHFERFLSKTLTKRKISTLSFHHLCQILSHQNPRDIDYEIRQISYENAIRRFFCSEKAILQHFDQLLPRTMTLENRIFLSQQKLTKMPYDLDKYDLYSKAFSFNFHRFFLNCCSFDNFFRYVARTRLGSRCIISL